MSSTHYVLDLPLEFPTVQHSNMFALHMTIGDRWVNGMKSNECICRSTKWTFVCIYVKREFLMYTMFRDEMLQRKKEPQFME